MCNSIVDWDRTVICIPTKRKPPIRTLESYPLPTDAKVILVCDPEVYDEHYDYYNPRSNGQIHIRKGQPGNGAQAAQCYIWPAVMNYELVFRMDDDLRPKTFITDEYGVYPELFDVVMDCVTCISMYDVTLVGLNSTARRDWLGDDYRLSYGNIPGQACMYYSDLEPDKYVDRSLTRYEDIWRTCAHRKLNKLRKNGLVSFVGIEQHGCTSDTVIQATQEQIDEAAKKVLDTFPDMVYSIGKQERKGSDYKVEIWRYKP